MADTMDTMESLTDQELEAVTVVFRRFETGLRSGTILSKVKI